MTSGKLEAMDSEAQIRTLIERWIAAINAGDLDAVVADHTADIVMFDVPPPYAGVRGLDEYRAAWPGFFGWLQSGAVFDLLELDVTAGAEVGFARALLRCGTPADLARNPDQRLRLTIGLVQQAGSWLISHEHHSFSDDSLPDAVQTPEPPATT